MSRRLRRHPSARRSRRDVLRAAGAAGTLGVTALAGCAAAPSDAAGSPEGSGTGGTSRPSTTAANGTEAVPLTDTVGMGCYTDSAEYFFRPGLIRVEPGTTVSFGVTSECGQQSLAYHPDNDAPLRIPEDAEPWSSPVLRGRMGGTFEVTLEVEGVYDYLGLHEGFGQVGSVIVGDPDPGGQPGLAPPQAEIPEPAREVLDVLNERTRSFLSDRGI